MTTPAQGRALAQAKGVCFQFAAAVRQRDSRMVRLTTDGLDRDGLLALAVLLAEALPDMVRLKIVKDADSTEGR